MMGCSRYMTKEKIKLPEEDSRERGVRKGDAGVQVVHGLIGSSRCQGKIAERGLRGR